MTNFLALALEQRQEEDEKEGSLALPSAGGQALGAAFGQKEEFPFDPGRLEPGEPLPAAGAAPRVPQEPQRAGRFAPPFLWDTFPRGQREGAGAPPLWERPRAFPTAERRPRALAPQWDLGPGQAWERGQEGEELPLLSALRRAERAAALVRGPRRHVTLTLPEAAVEGGGGLSAESLDRTVERDARRYGGGSVFY